MLLACIYYVSYTLYFVIYNFERTQNTKIGRKITNRNLVYSARLLKAVLNFRSREPWATLRMATRTGRTRPLEHETGKGKL